MVGEDADAASTNGIHITVPSSVERGTSDDRIADADDWIDADDLVAVPPDDWDVVADV